MCLILFLVLTYLLTINIYLQINVASPKVVIGYLQSYECRGTVRVYVDDDDKDFQLINSTSSSGVRVSQTYPHQLCLKNRIQCNTEGGGSSVDSHEESDLTRQSSVSATTHTHSTAATVNVAPSYFVANLTVDLLPVDTTVHSSVCGNRFKILYVISC